MFLWRILFLSFMIFSFSIANSEKFPLVVSVDWLKQHLNDKDVVVIDVRKEEVYKKGHIKGAVNMPVMKDFFTPKTLRIPKLSFLKELFSNAGIDANTKVIVYDNGQFCWAARAVWILKVLGHQNASLLEYGWGNYIKEHLPISIKTPKRERKEFIPRLNDELIATKLDVLIAIKKGLPILDGRTKEMYEGKTSIAKRYGHIPTAKLFAGAFNYKITEKGNRLKSFDELEDIYKGLPKNKKIIIYCQDGADAALDDLIMRKFGYNTYIYEGGWIEWANDPNLPIVNPSENSKK
jgi:thiosulfate/3-mercaptopyruvate sulfurtransferase